jgi:hypothetical protein
LERDASKIAHDFIFISIAYRRVSIRFAELVFGLAHPVTAMEK